MTEEYANFEEWDLELEEDLEEYFDELDDEDLEELDDLLIEEDDPSYDPEFE